VDNPPVLEELEVITEETGRRYKTPTGSWYPSITTVLSLVTRDGIAAWKAKVGEEYAESVKRRAGNRGTRFHEFTERYLNNQPVDVTTLNFLERDIFTRAIPTLNRIDNIVIQEAPLYSDYLKIAGRVDCIGEFDGKLSIIDFKTSLREKDEDHVQHYYMQAAAYAIMFEERTGIPITNLVLIVATDHGFVNIMNSKRDIHVKDLMYWRKQYKQEYGF
jgi:genome maintenance exonuclease 1